MPTSHRTHPSGPTDDRARSAGLGSPTEGAGIYLTDETFLYRIVRVVSGAAGAMVDLEDCFLLDIVRVPLAEVRARRLRVVAARVNA